MHAFNAKYLKILAKNTSVKSMILNFSVFDIIVGISSPKAIYQKFVNRSIWIFVNSGWMKWWPSTPQYVGKNILKMKFAMLSQKSNETNYGRRHQFTARHPDLAKRIVEEIFSKR